MLTDRVELRTTAVDIISSVMRQKWLFPSPKDVKSQKAHRTDLVTAHGGKAWAGTNVAWAHLKDHVVSSGDTCLYRIMDVIESDLLPAAQRNWGYRSLALQQLRRAREARVTAVCCLSSRSTRGSASDPGGGGAHQDALLRQDAITGG